MLILTGPREVGRKGPPTLRSVRRTAGPGREGYRGGWGRAGSGRRAPRARAWAVGRRRPGSDPATRGGYVHRNQAEDLMCLARLAAPARMGGWRGSSRLWVGEPPGHQPGHRGRRRPGSDPVAGSIRQPRPCPHFDTRPSVSPSSAGRFGRDVDARLVTEGCGDRRGSSSPLPRGRTVPGSVSGHGAHAKGRDRLPAKALQVGEKSGWPCLHAPGRCIGRQGTPLG